MSPASRLAGWRCPVGGCHEREGAYDLLENDSIAASDIAEMLFAALVEPAKGEPVAYVVVDDSLLALTDTNASKDFGPMGPPNCSARGLQVMSSLGVSRHGVGVVNEFTKHALLSASLQQ